MAWWQWPFFCIGVVTAFSLAVALAITAVHFARWAGGALATMLGRLGRSGAAPNRPEPRDTGLVTVGATDAPRSIISTEARVG
jgi:hypothetical protein